MTARKKRLPQVGHWRVAFGDWELCVVSDGTATRDVSSLLLNVTSARLGSLLSCGFRQSRMQLSMNTLLIDTGTQLLLIDTGAGDLFRPEGGLLSHNLRAAGYGPERIDAVILTHIHADHSGGLVMGGNPVFPSATIHVPEADFDFFMNEAEETRAPARYKHVFGQARTCLGPYVAEDRVRRFAWDRELFPGITSRAAPGHTPGHTYFELRSAGEKLLFLGDTVHVAEAQFPCPCAAVAFDVDPDAAVAQRHKAFADAAREGYWVGFNHVSFPGIGHIREEGDGYRWVPIPYLLDGLN